MYPENSLEREVLEDIAKNFKYFLLPYLMK
jgi:hypothetical protein